MQSISCGNTGSWFYLYQMHSIEIQWQHTHTQTHSKRSCVLEKLQFSCIEVKLSCFLVDSGRTYLAVTILVLCLVSTTIVTLVFCSNCQIPEVMTEKLTKKICVSFFFAMQFLFVGQEQW